MNDEISDDLEKQEQDQSETDDFNENPPKDIVAFNELRSCADLLRMYQTKQLIIQPDFQRDVVWTNPAQTRFIDSLIKQLPIPSMCISFDYNSGERLMIDGLQRMSSIISFLENKNWKLSKLVDVDPRISGRSAGYLREHQKELFEKVENLTIPITVLRCDYSKKSHMHYLFTIFHRLNTGANKLSNQEIRNCIFHGSFNNLLKTLVLYTNFRDLFSLDEGKTYRFAYEELLLRMFALHEQHESYGGKLAKFLNDYMEDKKKIDESEIKEKEQLMKRTINLVYHQIFDGKSIPKLSKATTEAFFVGIMQNIDNLEKESTKELNDRFFDLRKDIIFSIDSLSEGLSAKRKVTERINKAIEIFG